MYVNTGNRIINLNHFTDCRLVFEDKKCNLVCVEPNGNERRYTVLGITTYEELLAAYDELVSAFRMKSTFVDMFGK